MIFHWWGFFFLFWDFFFLFCAIFMMIFFFSWRIFILVFFMVTGFFWFWLYLCTFLHFFSFFWWRLLKSNKQSITLSWLLFSGEGDFGWFFLSLSCERSEEEEPRSRSRLFISIEYTHLLCRLPAGLRDLLCLWDLLLECCLLSLSSLYLCPDPCLECDLDLERDLERDLLLERLKVKKFL